MRRGSKLLYLSAHNENSFLWYIGDSFGNFAGILSTAKLFKVDVIFICTCTLLLSIKLLSILYCKDLEMEGPEPSDWDKFASEEYELLVAEESANEEQE